MEKFGGFAMAKGKFIVFEGLNGCGKSTQMKLFGNWLFEQKQSLGREALIVYTAEPNEGIDEYGKRGREILRSSESPRSKGDLAASLFAANRRTHGGLISILTGNGYDVLSSRYWHSNFAYQAAQGVSFDEIAELNRGCVVPDITFFIDVPVEWALSKIRGRGQKLKKFEREKEFLESVRKNYYLLSRTLPTLVGDESLVQINGVGSVDEVHMRIVKAYCDFLKSLEA
ncbi:dTMP kinase [Candidatus Pacearchaeota archaeon]|nr:MAG: dTMP kinase [Candidatus Pacearchaeota archaeon]